MAQGGPTAQRPEVSVGEASAFLAADLAFEPTNVHELSRGEWSIAFGFDSGGRSLVARFAHQRDDFDRDRLASDWASQDLPVPEIIDIARWGDGWVAISVFVNGSSFDDLPGTELVAALGSVLDGIDAMSTIEPSGVGWGLIRPDGTAAFESWRAFLTDAYSVADRLRGWRQRLDLFAGAGEAFDAGHSRLAALADSYCGPRRVVHGDLLAGNVLVEDRRVQVFLDWGCAMFGDPLFDLAMLVFWESWHPDELRLLERIAGRLRPTTVDFDDRLHACQLKVGLDAMAYCAYQGRSDNLRACITRVESLL